MIFQSFAFIRFSSGKAFSSILSKIYQCFDIFFAQLRFRQGSQKILPFLGLFTKEYVFVRWKHNISPCIDDIGLYYFRRISFTLKVTLWTYRRQRLHPHGAVSLHNMSGVHLQGGLSTPSDSRCGSVETCRNAEQFSAIAREAVSAKALLSESGLCQKWF